MILRGTVFSKVLEMDTPISVVGPDFFEEAAPRKVIYLLHGLCGGANSWVDNTMLAYYARNLNALFVLPEVGRSFYADLKYGQRFFSYVSEELPELAAKIFNISSSREDTAVMGGSMGGFGALKCALARPDFFGACGAFAPACLFLPEQLAGFIKSEAAAQKHAAQNSAAQKTAAPGGWSPNEQLKRDFLAMFGPEMQAGKLDDVMALAASVPAAARPRLYLACGLEDVFLSDLRRFSREVASMGFDLTYDELDGRHNWRFFDRALEKGLAWYFGLEAVAAGEARYTQL